MRRIGEVAEIVKKHVFHGGPLSREDLGSELGDVLWYLAHLADLIGMSLEEIASANATKLRARYPNGFEY